MLSVDFAQQSDEPFLLRACRRTRWQPLIGEVVEAAQLPESVLAAEFVEAWHAALAVADDIERGHVDPTGCARQARQGEVLQELRMVLQRERPCTLLAHGERPVGHSPRAHRLCGLAAYHLDHRNLAPDHLRIAVPVAVFDKVGDRKSTRLNSSHITISYAVFCVKKKKKATQDNTKKKKKYNHDTTSKEPTRK